MNWLPDGAIPAVTTAVADGRPVLIPEVSMKAIGEMERERRLVLLARRYPRLWDPVKGPIAKPGLATSRKIVLGLPSTRRMLCEDLV